MVPKSLHEQLVEVVQKIRHLLEEKRRYGLLEQASAKKDTEDDWDGAGLHFRELDSQYRKRTIQNISALL